MMAFSEEVGGGMACEGGVDPLKRRVALREYVKQLRGDNKENEQRGKGEESEKTSPGLVKQKTLGLCRRATVVVAGSGDKRKFNAPRQTPEKRQRPDEVSPATDQVRSRAGEMGGEMRQPVFSFDGGGDRQWSQDAFASPVPSPSRQAQLPESYTLPFKWQAPEPKTPSVRKPLAPVIMPVNRQTADFHPSPLDHYPSPMDQHSLPVIRLPSQPNSSGSNGPASSGNLFQTASGKPFQASAAAKARAALLFESDAELADFFAMDL